MKEPVQKPKVRNQIRLTLGKQYYTVKRYFKLTFSGYTFARIGNTTLKHTHFSHHTPLLRKLKDVDMYLQYNKIKNLKIAVPKVNHVTIHPGEVFSYWKLIGNPSKRKGYKKGLVLSNGSFCAGIGGGLCQLSNLIYWITLHTPLTIIERHRHEYDVFPDSDRTQPFGSGATCFYNYGDLLIKNDSNQSFQLIIEVTETDLKGAWVSDMPLQYYYEIYEKEHIIKHESWGGYTRNNILYRKKYNLKNTLIEDEFVVENHAIMMYSPMLSEQTR